MAIAPGEEYRKAFKLIDFFELRIREYEKEKKALDECILKLVNDRDNEQELGKKEQSDNVIVKYYEKHLTMANTHVKTVAESVEQIEDELRLKQELAKLLAQRLDFCKECKNSIHARVEELTKERPNLVLLQKRNITWETDTALPKIMVDCAAQGLAPGFTPIPLLSPEPAPGPARSRKGEDLVNVTPKKKSRVSFAGIDGDDNAVSTDLNIQAPRSTDLDIPYPLQLTSQNYNDSVPASNSSTPESVRIVEEYFPNMSGVARKSPRRQEAPKNIPQKNNNKSSRATKRARKNPYILNPDNVMNQLVTTGTVTSLRPSEGTSQQPAIKTFSRNPQQTEVLKKPTETDIMSANQLEPFWEGLTPYGPEVNMSPDLTLDEILNIPYTNPQNAGSTSAKNNKTAPRESSRGRNDFQQPEKTIKQLETNDLALLQRQRLHDQEMRARQQMKPHQSNMGYANAARPVHGSNSYESQMQLAQGRYYHGNSRQEMHSHQQMRAHQHMRAHHSNMGNVNVARPAHGNLPYPMQLEQVRYHQGDAQQVMHAHQEMRAHQHMRAHHSNMANANVARPAHSSHSYQNQVQLDQARHHQGDAQQEIHVRQQMRAHHSNMGNANVARPAHSSHSYQNQVQLDQARYHQGDNRHPAHSNVFQADLTDLMLPEEYEQNFPRSNRPASHGANSPTTEQDFTNDNLYNIPLRYEYDDVIDHNAHNKPDKLKRD